MAQSLNILKATPIARAQVTLLYPSSSKAFKQRWAEVPWDAELVETHYEHGKWIDLIWNKNNGVKYYVSTRLVVDV